MAEAYKQIAQIAPGATGWTTLHTFTVTTIAVIAAVNRADTGTNFSVAIDIGGSGSPPANAEILYDELDIGSHDTFIAHEGIPFSNTDVVYVNPGNTSMTFMVWGLEIS